MTAELAKLMEVAILAARSAGTLLRQRWEQPRLVYEKGDLHDWVTDADLAAQALITHLIRQEFPDHGFLAEEEDNRLSAFGPVLWVIDPIDGTSNYSRQQPNFCVSIAAAKESGEILIGAIYDPMRDELFTATQGQGSYLNGQRIQVSTTPYWSKSIVALDWSRLPSTQQQLLTCMQTIGSQTHTLRVIGSAALALAWIAAGRLDGYFNLGLSAWDAAAGALLIREAGGKVSNLYGENWQIKDIGSVAGNFHLHEGLLKIIKNNISVPTPAL